MEQRDKQCVERRRVAQRAIHDRVEAPLSVWISCRRVPAKRDDQAGLADAADTDHADYATALVVEKPAECVELGVAVDECPNIGGLGPIGEGRYQHTRRHAGEELIEPGGVEAAEMPFRLAVGLVPESSGLGRGSPRREAAMGGQSREEPAQAQSIRVSAATLPVQQGALGDADERRQVGGCKGGASAQAGQPLTKSACIVGRAGHRYAILSTSPAGACDRGEAGVSTETLPNVSTIVTRSHFGFSLHLTSFHTFIVACVLPITHGARRLPGPAAPCAARR